MSFFVNIIDGKSCAMTNKGGVTLLVGQRASMQIKKAAEILSPL